MKQQIQTLTLKFEDYQTVLDALHYAMKYFDEQEPASQDGSRKGDRFSELYEKLPSPVYAKLDSPKRGAK